MEVVRDSLNRINPHGQHKSGGFLRRCHNSTSQLRGFIEGAGGIDHCPPPFLFGGMQVALDLLFEPKGNLAYMHFPREHWRQLHSTDERVKDRAPYRGSFWRGLGSLLGVVDPEAKSRVLGLQALPRGFAPLRA
jgi:hypothetical protein